MVIEALRAAFVFIIFILAGPSPKREKKRKEKKGRLSSLVVGMGMGLSLLLISSFTHLLIIFESNIQVVRLGVGLLGVALIDSSLLLQAYQVALI